MHGISLWFQFESSLHVVNGRTTHCDQSTNCIEQRKEGNSIVRLCTSPAGSDPTVSSVPVARTTYFSARLRFNDFGNRTFRDTASHNGRDTPSSGLVRSLPCPVLSTVIH